MKVVADDAIPFLRGVLEPYADVSYISGDVISRRDVASAEVLIIRTRTRCNAELLHNSKIRLIATATIGFDHIDLQYCQQNGIEVITAEGCNARGVLQWVGAVLVYLSTKQGWSPQERTLGIVGVGHVGSLVKSYAELWGFRVLCCDPPRENREHLGFCTLKQVATQADIITLHTPLDSITKHMVDSTLLGLMKSNAVVINSSRGEVVDSDALLDSDKNYILDVWEHEPSLMPKLLQGALLSTPHIAGYSLQGKANATAIVINALSDHFGWPLKGWYPPNVKPTTPRMIEWQELCESIGKVLDIEVQSRNLKEHKDNFEALRNNYHYRNEYF